MKEAARVHPDDQQKEFQFRLYRVPFFLEPDYLHKPEHFWESHDTRMIRKFGSKEAFERVKLQHQLVPRGREAGLTESMGFTEENLSRRNQSSTLDAHRLIQYISKEYSPELAERVYDILNRKHFIEGGILNDRSLLLSAVDEVGLNTRKCDEYLATMNGITEVLEMVETVHSLGIHSIPVLIINGGQEIVQGAAPTQEILQHIRVVLKNPRPSSLLIQRS